MYLAITLKTIDATKLAADAGTPQTMNVVMLGALGAYTTTRRGANRGAQRVSSRSFWKSICVPLNLESERFKNTPGIVYSISFSTIIANNVFGVCEVAFHKLNKE